MGWSVIVGGVRPTAALNPGDDHSVAVAVKRYGETILTDTNLPMGTIWRGLAVIRWITPRRVDYLVQFVEDSLLVV
jgi:hypothetical protein